MRQLILSILLVLLLCVPLPLYVPDKPPVIETFTNDKHRWTYHRIGPVVIIVGEDFKAEGEFRNTHWNLHWYVNGEFSQTSKVKDLPKASPSLFGDD